MAYEVNKSIYQVCNTCKTFTFGCKQHQILGAVQCSSKHCSCHPQDEYVLVGQSQLSYVGQGVDGVLYMMEWKSWLLSKLEISTHTTYSYVKLVG
jgi:hypothetical protein